MSYVLHIWEAPRASNIEEAVSIVFYHGEKDVGQNAKFLDFARALTAVYPDAGSVGQGDCIWAENRLDGKTDRSVMTLDVRTDAIGESLFGFVAHTAADHGLHVFDMQAGRLYRPDRSVVDDSGRPADFPDRHDVIAVEVANDNGIKGDDGMPIQQDSVSVESVSEPQKEEQNRPGHPQIIYPWGHVDDILCVAVSPDGTRCLTGSKDCCVRLWDVVSGVCLLSLNEHADAINCVAFSGDGKRCLTGSADNTVRLWDCESGDCLQVLQKHEDEVSALAFFAHGDYCLTGGLDKNVILWNLETEECLQIFKGHTAAIRGLSFSDDRSRCLTASDDCTVRLWDVQTAACLLELQGHEAGIVSVAFAADGKRCLTGSRDKTARLWDTQTGACLLTFQGHADTVTGVTFSADGRCLTCGCDGVRQWDAHSGTCLQIFMGPGDLSCAALSTHGDLYLAGDQDCSARLWNVNSGDCLQLFAGHANPVFAVALSGDGRRCLVAGKEPAARLWSGSLCKAVLRGHEDRITSVSLTFDGRYCLTGSYDKTARVWDAEKSASLLTLEGHRERVTSVAFSADGRRCLTGSYDGTARVWDTHTGTCIKTLSGHGDKVTSVAFSADGSRCLTGTHHDDKTARLWDAETGACLFALRGHAYGITSVAFSDDGRRCLTGSHDCTARLWDVQNGICLFILQGHDKEVSSVALSGDGCICLTGSADMTARIWSTDSNVIESLRLKCLRRMSLKGKPDIEGWRRNLATLKTGDSMSGILQPAGRHDMPRKAPGISPLGRSNRLRSKLWSSMIDTELAECTLVLSGHVAAITSVALTTDGRRCLTGSLDNTARRWDTRKGNCLAWMWAVGKEWFCLDGSCIDEDCVIVKLGPLLRTGSRGVKRLKFSEAGNLKVAQVRAQWSVSDFPEFLHQKKKKK